MKYLPCWSKIRLLRLQLPTSIKKAISKDEIAFNILVFYHAC